MWLDSKLQSRGLPKHQKDLGRRLHLLWCVSPRVRVPRPPGDIWQCLGMLGAENRLPAAGQREEAGDAGKHPAPLHGAEDRAPNASRAKVGGPRLTPGKALAKRTLAGRKKRKKKERKTKLFVMRIRVF